MHTRVPSLIHSGGFVSRLEYATDEAFRVSCFVCFPAATPRNDVQKAFS